MKTPHEVLLQHHQSAESKLDQVRCAAVMGLQGRQAAREQSLPIAVVLKLWNELIWPVRRIWTGVAVAWVFIVIANANLSDGQPATLAKDAKPVADMFLAWREQDLVLAELAGKADEKIAEPPKRPTTQPRSERTDKWAAA